MKPVMTCWAQSTLVRRPEGKTELADKQVPRRRASVNTPTPSRYAASAQMPAQMAQGHTKVALTTSGNTLLAGQHRKYAEHCSATVLDIASRRMQAVQCTTTCCRDS